jgi:hypothetical protein
MNQFWWSIYTAYIFLIPAWWPIDYLPQVKALVTRHVQKSWSTWQVPGDWTHAAPQHMWQMSWQDFAELASSEWDKCHTVRQDKILYLNISLLYIDGLYEHCISSRTDREQTWTNHVSALMCAGRLPSSAACPHLKPSCTLWTLHSTADRFWLLPLESVEW